jgi:replication fork protection complex subunit Tof1/Swi1
MNSTVFYLEYGHEKQTIPSKRPPAELQIITKEDTTPEAKLGIVVGALVLDGRADLAKWIVDVLNLAASEREDWEASEEARRAEKENPEEVDSTPRPMIRMSTNCCVLKLMRP